MARKMMGSGWRWQWRVDSKHPERRVKVGSIGTHAAIYGDERPPRFFGLYNVPPNLAWRTEIQSWILDLTRPGNLGMCLFILGPLRLSVQRALYAIAGATRPIKDQNQGVFGHVQALLRLGTKAKRNTEYPSEEKEKHSQDGENNGFGGRHTRCIEAAVDM